MNQNEVTLYVFVFFNPNSGNKQGRHLMQYNGQFVRLKRNPHIQVQMYNLIDKKDGELGFNFLVSLYKTKPTCDLIVCSAGGDGTFVSILETLRDLSVPIDDQRIAFTSFPFGTGNDLSQALGWEKNIRIHHTKYFDTFYDYIEKRLVGSFQKLDIWNVNITARKDGFIQQSPHNEKSLVINRMMCNYMTLGVQGLIGYGFEKHRHRSRTWNIIEYVKQSLKRGIFSPIERVPTYFNSIKTPEGNLYYMSDKMVKKPIVELVAQNVPGLWGRQVNLWDKCRNFKGSGSALEPSIFGANKENWHKTMMDDEKLDLYFIRSRLQYGLKQIPCIMTLTRLARMGQFESGVSLLFNPDTTFHAMIDGEFFLLHDIEMIKMERITAINVIVGGKNKSGSPAT